MVVVEKDDSCQFVDRRITMRKFERQVDDFIEREDEYRKAGIICQKLDFPHFEFAFLAKYSYMHKDDENPPVQLFRPYPFFLFAVRIDYTNYDILAPSIRIIDPFTSEITSAAIPCPIVIAPSQQNNKSILDAKFKVQNQNILLKDNKGHFFICLRGIREYHEHPQHNGDSWFLHRLTGKGDILNILDQLQLYSVSNFNRSFEQQIKLGY